MSKLRITCTRSPIGYSKDQRKVVQSLGLRRLNSTVEHDNSPQIRGMIHKIRHLVEVEEFAQEGEA